MPHLTTYSFSLDNSKQASFLSSVLCDQLKAHFPQLQSVFLSQSAKFTCITISGTTNDVNSAKQDLLKLQPVEVALSIHSLYPGIGYRTIAREKLHDQLKSVAMKHDMQIIVDYNQLMLKLIGPVDRVELARIDVLLYFDHLLGLTSNILNMPLCTHNVLGSRKHSNILSIMEETGTNIYLPSPWTKLTQPSNNLSILKALSLAESESNIHVTGSTTEAVQKATTLLRKLLPQKIKTMCNSQSILNPRKRDWLLLYKKDELDKIMKDNGSHIAFPPFGSESLSQIQVYAENNVNVERTLRSLNYLTSHIFQAMIYVNTVQSPDIVARLSQDAGAEVIYRTDTNRFEITGSKQQIQSVVQIIRTLPISQEQHKSVIFSIELALDQREFISGKKNGKINKIMKSCDADIQFQAFNDYNFIITIESEDFFKAKDGLESLQNELPAEISFFVPEICHRRIIGVAGKNIQRVMKQYGVYVKFSSNEELATFGGYFENEHNIVARTPEKNIQSLLKLKAAVMEFITFQKDRDYISRPEFVPFYIQRTLLHHHGKYLRDKGRLYNSRITWPERNGTDHVLITGPQSHIEEMQLRVQSLLPQSIDIQVPASVVLENIFKSPDLEELQQKIHIKTGIFLILPDALVLSSDVMLETDPNESADHFKIEPRQMDSVLFSDCRVLTFRLYFDASSKSQLSKARQMFDAFMGSRFVPIDDTLHNNALNGSPSPEDMRHISPSVMHHIDHPESYEGPTGKKPELMDQNSAFFQQKKQLSTPATGSQLRKGSLQPSSTDFFSVNRGFEQQENNHAIDDFNVWAENPVSPTGFHHHPLKPSRSNIPKTNTQFFYPRPELKANYSTSSVTSSSSHNNNDTQFNSLNNYYQFANSNSSSSSSNSIRSPPPQQTQADYIHGANYSFAPIGYSRQRSTSLIPPGVSSQQFSTQPIVSSSLSTSSSTTAGLSRYNSNSEMKSYLSSFGPYPFNMTNSTSRIDGIAPQPSYDYYTSNHSQFYPFDRRNPSNSLSTPIPVAVNSNDNNHSLKSIHSQRFNYY
ncbi:hypothetical protein A0J61_08034 [Choanephora cucurbitarum]|uniref:K Homology domain-containing protein n=1 Tax=Choanephora cucurbitarum TaxID=101091 RepID=A0A1C7N5J6_9FUNG|nr:hypothetical protein A0J61_08034 [Choanephora cucurbitarum]